MAIGTASMSLLTTASPYTATMVAASARTQASHVRGAIRRCSAVVPTRDCRLGVRMLTVARRSVARTALMSSSPSELS